MKMYNMDKTKDYLVYGAGGNGIRVAKRIKELNLNLLAILDKRAEHIENKLGLPIWKIDKLKDINFKQNIIIFVTVKNVFEHDFIVKDLYELGFENIIYVPRKILDGKKNKELEYVYDLHKEIVEENNFNFKYNIPSVRYEYFDFFRNRLWVKNVSENEKLVLLPIILISNYLDESKYGGFPMISFFPILELYMLLSSKYSSISKSDTVENFLEYSSEWVKKNDLFFSNELKENMITSRVKIFNEMSNEYQLNKNHFLNNAPRVKNYKNMNFNLISSGRNRVAFQIAMGEKFIPVIISDEEYIKWMNIDVKNKIIKFLEKNKNFNFFTTIPHPELINCLTFTTEYTISVISYISIKILKMIIKENYEDGKTIINYVKKVSIMANVKDNGTVSRFFSSLGFNVFRKKIDCEIENECIKLLDELLYSQKENIEYINKFKKVDISIIDNLNSEQDIISCINNTNNVIYLIIYGENNINEYCDVIKEKLKIIKVFESIWDGIGVYFYEIIKVNII